jgi:hypothetical protein
MYIVSLLQAFSFLSQSSRPTREILGAPYKRRNRYAYKHTKFKADMLRIISRKIVLGIPWYYSSDIAYGIALFFLLGVL